MTTEDSFKNAVCAVPLEVGATESMLTCRSPSLHSMTAAAAVKWQAVKWKVFLKCVIKPFLFPEKFTNPRLQETLNNHGLQVAHWGCWTHLNWKTASIYYEIPINHMAWNLPYFSLNLEGPHYWYFSSHPEPPPTVSIKAKCFSRPRH